MCDERERLIGYVYDECDDDARRVIETHLVECATCREEIAGLRGVRQDLLAWELPEHISAWRPFVPRPAPWWREVPAWAMATAASLVFLLGAAGGVVTHAFMSPAERVASAQADARAVQAPPLADAPDVSPAQLSEMEQRIVNMMRTELNQRVRLASTRGTRTDTVAASSIGLTPEQIADLINDSESRQLRFATGVHNALVTSNAKANSEINGLRRQVQELRDLVLTQAGR